jgi:opacity protein-like surface antigen
MKRILIGAALASLAFGPAYAQAVTQMNGTTCLKTVLVDHTQVIDASTIIYTMKSGEVLKNTLKNPCTTLPHNGYIYTPTPPDNICGNLQMIKVIQTGEVCQLGTFTPMPPKEKDGH